MDRFLGKVLGGDDNERQSTGGHSRDDDDDFRGAASHAAEHAPEDSSFFSDILGQLGQRKQQIAEEDIDEEDAVRNHRNFFDDSAPTSSDKATSSGMGSAAAMQALKMFSGGSGSSSSSSSSSSGSGSQSQFIGLAMAQASKLFDQQASAGNVSSGADKQSVVAKAGEMAFKMYVKSQMSGGGGGPASGSNLSGLLGMASKYM
ncbi:hypothetical protein B0T24DRAFT_16213 [Lasiosphaeria ovina]|uniref:DUF7721 domain-containing protein n=1 Tax=Lasiosphaeria ovina TaxID=92902 RepID=A0AAE0NJ54_9PEZI|nr:hypothetical protein B0T24DRAFT_16213 [Lasiosphaeria ovina]